MKNEKYYIELWKLQRAWWQSPIRRGITDVLCGLIGHKMQVKVRWVNDCSPENPNGENLIPSSYKVNYCERCRRNFKHN
jgi:hypothetical protein